MTTQYRWLYERTRPVLLARNGVTATKGFDAAENLRRDFGAKSGMMAAGWRGAPPTGPVKAARHNNHPEE